MKNMWKKWVTVAMLTVAFSAFAACGNRDDNTEKDNHTVEDGENNNLNDATAGEDQAEENNTNDNTEENMTNGNETDNGQRENDDNVVEDLGEDVGEGIKDVGEGIGEGVEDITGGGSEKENRNAR